MSVFKVCACAILCAVFITTVGKDKGKGAYSFAMSALAGIMIMLAALDEAMPMISYLRDLGVSDDLTLYMGILLRSLGAAFICEASAGVCRECGEAELASRVELFCKFEIVALCFPLFRNVLETAQSLIG